MTGKKLFTGIATLALMCAAMVSSGAKSDNDIVVFRISPQGDDAAAGSVDAPWRTPEAAAGHVLEYMAAHPGQAVRLEFAPGRYQIGAPLMFEGLSAPLTLVSSGEGEVVLSGEVPVKGWKAANGVWEADLRECGISDFGDVASRTNRFDLYAGGKRQTLARWPDKGFANAGKAVGETTLGDTWIHVHGTVEGVLEYPDARMKEWLKEADPWLFGYWYWDWADKYHQLASVDSSNGTFTLSEPWSGYGYRDSCRFYGINLLCELDSPGEYYVDRKSGKILWIAPSGDAASEKTSVPVFNARAMIIARDCNALTISGLNFEGGRQGAVRISGGEDCSVSDCSFTRFGDTVIEVNGGKGHSIKGCYLHELGCAGISMTGGDRRTLEPSGFVVEDNIVEDFSLFKRTYEPAVYFHGVGLLVSHNRFQRSSSSALRLEGNDITVEYNQCFNLVEESDDQGGFDSFYDYTYRNLVIRYNHWRDISGGMYAGAAGVRLDDIISGQTIYSNIFERCGGGPEGAGFGGVQINGGRDNLIYNNLFYDCRYAVSGRTFQGEQWRKALSSSPGKERLDEMAPYFDLYEQRYPGFKASLESESGCNYVYCNIVVNAEAIIRETTGFMYGGNALLRSHATLESFLIPVNQRNNGLEPIPFGEIGPKDNRWK